MLYSTLDLLTRATSSDLYVFCFISLIIVMIFMVSKHDSNLDQDCEILIPTPANDSQDIEVEHSLESSEQGTNASGVVLCVYETVVSEDSRVSEDDYNDNNSDTDEKDENNEEEGDETKRIEEFIAKVNREWRAEMLRTYSYEKDENHEEEGDDERTKRIEEFISKVNRERRAEMLRTSS